MYPAYHFRIGPLSFILNPQFSGIGYCYPRIFIRFPNNSYLNCDIALDAMFKMTEKDWLSWLDGTEKSVDDIKEVRTVCHECGINWDAFEELAFELYNEHKDSE